MAVLTAASQGQKTHAIYHNLVLYAPEIWTMSKAFRTIELKMPDIVGLSPILTQKLTHFHIWREIKPINQTFFRFCSPCFLKPVYFSKPGAGVEPAWNSHSRGF